MDISDGRPDLRVLQRSHPSFFAIDVRQRIEVFPNNLYEQDVG
jgi:hypothetical protein